MLLALLLAASCGGGGDATPDASPDASPPDAMPPGPAACREMDTEPRTVPLHQVGDVLEGGADLLAPADCAVIDAPFGVESAGVDRVVKLAGLAAGVEYGVSLSADADLGFYVVTGCSTATGPSGGECALYVDAVTGGNDEVGRFTATGTTAWVVIDTYSSTPPVDGSYAVDVYPVTCDDDSACAGTTPACLAGRCVGCVDSFDCMMGSAPSCDTGSHTCVGGNSCPGDDAGDPNDDGPGGAQMFVLDGSGHGAIAAEICDVPTSEADYFGFVVSSPGETWQFDLTWASSADLDLYAYDAQGGRLGLSWYEQPETIALTYLAPGTYYLMVDNFAGGSGPGENYTVTAQRTLGPGCTGPDDCAAEYRNQIYRGDCVAGSCVAIAGGGAVAEGNACDNNADCAPGLWCPSFYFVADADTRDVCARDCDTDTDCAPLGTDYVCTTYLGDNFCVQKCTDDEQCPTSPGTTPPYADPWYRLSCQVSTGRCLP